MSTATARPFGATARAIGIVKAPCPAPTSAISEPGCPEQTEYVGDTVLALELGTGFLSKYCTDRGDAALHNRYCREKRQPEPVKTTAFRSHTIPYADLFDRP